MLAALAVSIPLVVGECVLDVAVVTHVPPATVHVIAVSECGGVRCWTRYVETNGQRIRETRVCAGESSTFVVTPPPKAPLP